MAWVAELGTSNPVARLLRPRAEGGARVAVLRAVILGLDVAPIRGAVLARALAIRFADASGLPEHSARFGPKRVAEPEGGENM